MSRKKPEKKQVSQEWLTTYSDMMTLLLTFFVLLYSYSNIDAKKFQQIATSLASALGGTNGTIVEGGSVGPTPINQSPGNSDSNLSNSGNMQDNEAQKVYNEVLNFVKDKDLEAKVTIKKETRGVLIELQDKILFDSGKASIKDESLPLLNKISELLSTFPNEVIIEGHTDNLPINKGYYQSNWELSNDRAVKVVRYFVDKRNMDGSRFQAVGCGEYRPIDTNATPEGRQNNRRVNILIVTKKNN